MEHDHLAYREIAHPVTGKIIDLDAATPEQLGSLRIEMYDLKRLAETTRIAAEKEIKRRARAQGELNDGVCRWVVSRHEVTHVYPEPLEREKEPCID